MFKKSHLSRAILPKTTGQTIFHHQHPGRGFFSGSVAAWTAATLYYWYDRKYILTREGYPITGFILAIAVTLFEMDQKFLKPERRAHEEAKKAFREASERRSNQYDQEEQYYLRHIYRLKAEGGEELSYFFHRELSHENDTFNKIYHLIQIANSTGTLDILFNSAKGIQQKYIDRIFDVIGECENNPDKRFKLLERMIEKKMNRTKTDHEVSIPAPGCKF